MMTDIFTHCPYCGETDLDTPHPNAIHCNACDGIYFMNAAAAVAVIIVNRNNEMLLVRRAKDPAKGLWDLPGGFSDWGETLEQTVQREVQEELGAVSLSNIAYWKSYPNRYVYNSIEYNTLDCIFEARLDGDIVLDTAELTEYQWCAFADITPEMIGLDSLRRAVTDYITTHSV